MILTRHANLIVNGLLALTYPEPCVLCGRSVEDRAFFPACSGCWSKTRIFSGDEAVCWKCGALVTLQPTAIRNRSAPTDAPQASSLDVSHQSLRLIRQVGPEEIRCHRCDAHEFQTARACGLYEGALRASALHLKRQPYLSKHLRSLLVTAAKKFPLNTATRIIPVPLHPDRERRRGFNQAAIIARAISPKLGLPVDELSLTRIVASEKYRAGLDAKGRLDTVAGAFAVRLPKLIEGESILLLDDVFTTGATATSCASVLLAAGALEVQVLTVARPL